MHTIEPARLKPGAAIRSRLAAAAPVTLRRLSSRPLGLIRGRALIFWDPKSPPATRKLDAIDTDQITPAADCVSESLETLDERWKAGSFRYLMPDFRARVHRGETFVIAGDRFAIGSSREMSPAGLKGVAEEAGLRDGRSSAATTWATSSAATPSTSACTSCRARRRWPTRRTATSSRSIRSSRELRNETQGKTYEPVPLSPKEDEIRRSGGIFAVGRREFRGVGATRAGDRLAGRRRSAPDDDDRADRLGAPRRQGICARGPRARARRCASTPICCRRRTAPRRSRSTPSTRSPAATRSIRARRRSPTITSSSPAVDDDDKQTGIGREFARAARHREAVLRDAGRRHLPFLFSRAGAGDAGPVHSRRRLAQPRLRRLRRGRHRRRIDDARVRLVDRLHLLHAGARQRRVVFDGPAAALGQRQGHRPRAAAALGREAVAGDVGGARRRGPAAADRLSQHHREHDGGGRSAERHLRARRRSPTRGIAQKGIDRRCRIRRSRPAPTRVYEIDETLDLARRAADDRQAVQSRATRFRPRRSRASASRSTRR